VRGWQILGGGKLEKRKDEIGGRTKSHPSRKALRAGARGGGPFKENLWRGIEGVWSIVGEFFGETIPGKSSSIGCVMAGALFGRQDAMEVFIARIPFGMTCFRFAGQKKRNRGA
jgi:hypothetical protein